jgi:hypothetical protein
MALLKVEHQSRIGDACAGQRANGSGRNGVDADIMRSKVGGEVAHGRLESGLCHISAAARFATSVKEKQDITMVRMKLSREVSA